MDNDFNSIPVIDKGCDTSTTLAYPGLKKNYKIHKILFGVSSLIFLSNTDFSPFAHDSVYCEEPNCIYIPNSVCFPGETGTVKPISFNRNRKVVKAKFKKQYFISDEELENRLSTGTDLPPLQGKENADIDDFIKYNSGRFKNSLDQWL